MLASLARRNAAARAQRPASPTPAAPAQRPAPPTPENEDWWRELGLSRRPRMGDPRIPAGDFHGIWLNSSELRVHPPSAEPVVEILDNVNNNRHAALVALPDREFEFLDPRVRQIANMWIHIISEQIAQAIVYIILSTVMGHLGFFGGYKRKTKKLRNKINKRKTKNKKKNKVNRRKTRR